MMPASFVYVQSVFGGLVFQRLAHQDLSSAWRLAACTRNTETHEMAGLKLALDVTACKGDKNSVDFVRKMFEVLGSSVRIESDEATKLMVACAWRALLSGHLDVMELMTTKPKAAEAIRSLPIKDTVLGEVNSSDKPRRENARRRVLCAIQAANPHTLLTVDDHWPSDDLNLQGLALTALPECMCVITVKGSLHLQNNQLVSLPAAFGYILTRGDVILSENSLQSLPASFGCMVCERSLHLENNKLERLPESFGNMTVHGNLWLHGNELETLPESFNGITLGEKLSLCAKMVSARLGLNEQLRNKLMW